MTLAKVPPKRASAQTHARLRGRGAHHSGKGQAPRSHQISTDHIWSGILQIQVSNDGGKTWKTIKRFHLQGLRSQTLHKRGKKSR